MFQIGKLMDVKTTKFHVRSLSRVSKVLYVEMEIVSKPWCLLELLGDPNYLKVVLSI